MYTNRTPSRLPSAPAASLRIPHKRASSPASCALNLRPRNPAMTVPSAWATAPSTKRWRQAGLRCAGWALLACVSLLTFLAFLAGWHVLLVRTLASTKEVWWALGGVLSGAALAAGVACRRPSRRNAQP